jgi:mono/diheme cytochrome c family protein
MSRSTSRRFPAAAGKGAVLAGLLGLCLVPADGLAQASDPQDRAGQAPHAGSLVERGRYLANVAGCGACHTAADGDLYAGGHVLKTPYGPIAVPNITPDDDTGIGTWSLEDFRNALHHGRNAEGQPLYPAMPYLHYTKMRDDDVEAIWAYVQSVPAVTNRVKVNRLRFPYDVRASLNVWRALYFQAGRFEPNPDKSEAWNRGAYIVDALAHCGACHTPRDALGGPIEGQALRGARIEEWYAPDISGGPGSVIADWSAERLRAFLSGDSADHVALGSMQLVVDDLAKVNADDLDALVTYLMDQPSTEAGAAPPPAVRVTAADRARWESLFDANCATCHGADGEGGPDLAASLVGAGGVLADRPTNIITVLLEGMRPRGDYGAMPSFRNQLSNQQIADLANYVRTAWSNEAPPNATAEMVAGLRNVTETKPGVMEAALCPNTPMDRVDQQTRAKIRAMVAAAKDPSADAVGDILADYRKRNPDSTTTQAVTDLGGVYCRAVAAAGEGRGTVARRELKFMNAVIESATAG